MRNILVAIEGIDGSGKATQTAKLVESLRKLGLKSDSISFPRYSKTTFGGFIGKYLNGGYGSLNEVHPELVAILNAGDRFESKQYLIEMLNSNDVLVLDRYVGSSIAYQMPKNEDIESVGKRWIDFIEDMEYVKFGMPKPAVNILIDMPVDISSQLVLKKKKRNYTDNSEDLHESNKEYLSKVRDAYLHIVESKLHHPYDINNRWRVVSGADDYGNCKTVNEVASRILSIVTNITRQNTLF